MRWIAKDVWGNHLGGVYAVDTAHAMNVAYAAFGAYTVWPHMDID